MEVAGKSRSLESASARVPPHLFFIGSAVFHYLGPSFAVLLFARVPVAGVAWLRIVSAGAIFAVWRRPWRVIRRSGRSTKGYIVGLGVVFALMNYSFYIAIDRLPLGTVAALEFLGPIVLALAGARSLRNIAAVGFAAGGVYLLTEVRFDADPGAFAWAFANAALFTLYIILAHKMSRSDPSTSPIDRLGASMLIASLAITPLGLSAALPALTDPVALAAGIGVGVSSSVIPYVFDQLAMSRLARATYALFVALLPATAVAIGIIVLRQIPLPIDLAGIALVILAILTHRQPGAVEDQRDGELTQTSSTDPEPLPRL